MWNAILAALRSSEFWAFLGPVVLEALSSPVPEDVKMFSWLYAGYRVLSKVLKYIFPNGIDGKWMATGAAIALALLSLASPAMAQVEPVPITDVGARAHVMVNGGAMVITSGDDWSGASLGGTLVYNLHPDFSVFGGYDHGFPINNQDDDLDLWRAVGNIRVHPNALIGFGYAKFSEGVEGGLAQITVYKKVAAKMSMNVAYSHVFSKDDLEDFEWARVYLNYQLLGR